MRRTNRRLKKKRIILLIIIVILMISLPIFGRYTYNSLREMYLASKKFYYTSNLLGENKTYTNWGGSEVYVVNFELYSYDNKLRKMEENLDCAIRAKVNSGNVKCYIASGGSTTTESTDTTLNKTITVTNDNKIRVSVYIIPVTKIANGNNVVVEISATSVSPYEKKLTSNITLTSTAQEDYKIVDKVDDDYAELILSNSKTEDVTVSLTFNPETIRIDSNDPIFDLATTSYTDTTVNGVSYINTINFKLSGENAKNIKFYKTNKKNNYSYEQNNNETSESIINVNF